MAVNLKILLCWDSAKIKDDDDHNVDYGEIYVDFAAGLEEQVVITDICTHLMT